MPTSRPTAAAAATYLEPLGRERIESPYWTVSECLIWFSSLWCDRVLRYGKALLPDHENPGGSVPPKSRGARRTRGSLTREQVMEAALRVADQDGLSEVSMARVAQELAVPGASLYRHADGRHDLIVGLCDHALQAW